MNKETNHWYTDFSLEDNVAKHHYNFGFSVRIYGDWENNLYFGLPFVKGWFVKVTVGDSDVKSFLCEIKYKNQDIQEILYWKVLESTLGWWQM